MVPLGYPVTLAAPLMDPEHPTGAGLSQTLGGTGKIVGFEHSAWALEGPAGWDPIPNDFQTCSHCPSWPALAWTPAFNVQVLLAEKQVGQTSSPRSLGSTPRNLG